MVLSEPAGRQLESETAGADGAGGPGLTYRDLQRAIFLVAGLVIVYHLAAPLTTLLLFFLLVFILAAVLNPVVVWLQGRGVPRTASAIGIAMALLGLFTLVGFLAIPPLLDELTRFAGGLDDKQAELTRYYQQFVQRYPALAQQLPDPASLMQNLGPNVARLVGQVGKYTVGLAAGVLSLLLLVVLVVYTLAHPAPLVAGLLAAVPDRHRGRAEAALRRILTQLKNWALGSLILGLIVGLMCGVGLKLIGMPYALLFGVIAGVGELIPNIGPILSAVPPALVGLTLDPKLGLYVLVLFVIVQQLENNLIVPLVMGQSLNLHPISVTFTVLVMGVLFGVLGAILAVPMCAIVKVCWEEFYLFPRRADPQALEAIAQEIVSSGSPDPRDQPGMARAARTLAERRRTRKNRPAAGGDRGAPPSGGDTGTK